MWATAVCTTGVIALDGAVMTFTGAAAFAVFAAGLDARWECVRAHVAGTTATDSSPVAPMLKSFQLHR